VYVPNPGSGPNPWNGINILGLHQIPFHVLIGVGRVKTTETPWQEILNSTVPGSIVHNSKIYYHQKLNSIII
jgi:hypothetical protein